MVAKRTMTLNLTDAEMHVLEELSRRGSFQDGCYSAGIAAVPVD